MVDRTLKSNYHYYYCPWLVTDYYRFLIKVMSWDISLSLAQIESFCLFVGNLICWSIHFECFLSVPRPQLGYMSLCVVGVISGWFFSAQAVTHQTKNRCKTIQVVVWGTECMTQMQ